MVTKTHTKRVLCYQNLLSIAKWQHLQTARVTTVYSLSDNYNAIKT